MGPCWRGGGRGSRGGRGGGLEAALLVMFFFFFFWGGGAELKEVFWNEVELDGFLLFFFSKAGNRKKSKEGGRKASRGRSISHSIRSRASLTHLREG